MSRVAAASLEALSHRAMAPFGPHISTAQTPAYTRLQAYNSPSGLCLHQRARAAILRYSRYTGVQKFFLIAAFSSSSLVS